MPKQNDIDIRAEYLSKDVFYEDTPILKIKIMYPLFSSQSSCRALLKMNRFYKTRAESMLEEAMKSLAPAALEDYKNSKENGFPVHEYQLSTSFQVTNNYDCFISLYHDKYEYTGGAHGNTSRTSETWSLKNGAVLPLEYFFPCRPQYIKEIKSEIIRQIETQISQGDSYYFEDYKKLVDENFDEKNYYLVPGAVVVFFRQYDIAPYASGMPEFIIHTNIANNFSN